MNEYNLAVFNNVYFGILAPIFLGVVYFFEQNKQRLSCANLRPATLLSLLVLVNSELWKCEKEIKTRLITMRSKPDYVEFVFL